MLDQERHGQGKVLADEVIAGIADENADKDLQSQPAIRLILLVLMQDVSMRRGFQWADHRYWLFLVMPASTSSIIGDARSLPG